MSLRHLSPACALALALTLGGCWVESRRPFHFADEALHLDGLAGQWRPVTGPESEEASETVEIVARGESYESGSGAPEDPKWRWTLFRLDGELFADEAGGDGDGRAGRRSRHQVLRLRLAGDRLEVDQLDAACLERGLAAKTLPAAYKQKRRGDEILLTGSTAELKGVLVWALAHGCFDQAEHRLTLERVSAAPTGGEVGR